MNIRIYLLIILVPIMFAGCEDDDLPVTENPSLYLVDEALSDLGLFSTKLWSVDTLFEGYNKMYFEIKNKTTGIDLPNATLSLMPLMHMIDKSHSAPFENPGSIPNSDGYFEGAVVFIMPDNPDEEWTLQMAIDYNGITDTVNYTIPLVKSLTEARKISVISPIDDTKYFISLLEPLNPFVGINEIEFTVHYKKTMMSFPAAEDITIEFEPEMPSMDHGSPNNVQAVHTANGHYKGKVNFTMTGWWRLNLTIKKGNELITDEAEFNITF